MYTILSSHNRHNRLIVRITTKAEKMDVTAVPDFDDLPTVAGMPQGCAWGVFDKDGKKDLLGTLNLLTASVVKAAYSEAQDGVSISLK